MTIAICDVKLACVHPPGGVEVRSRRVLHVPRVTGRPVPPRAARTASGANICVDAHVIILHRMGMGC